MDRADRARSQGDLRRAPWGMAHEVIGTLVGSSGIGFFFSAPPEAIQFADYLRLLVARSQGESRLAGATQPNPPLIGIVSR